MSDPINGNGNNPPANAPTDQVPKAELDKVLGELTKAKSKSQAAETELTSLRSTVEELQTKLASGNEDYKALFEGEKAKRVAAEGERETFKKNVLHSERHRAAYPALKKAGLADAAENLIDHMDLNAIDIEVTSNGRFIPSGVDKFVDEAKKKYPYAFTAAKAPIVNGGTGSGGPQGDQKWTPEKLVALERDCKRKGDMRPYQEAVAEWQKQKRA